MSQLPAEVAVLSVKSTDPGPWFDTFKVWVAGAATCSRPKLSVLLSTDSVGVPEAGATTVSATAIVWTEGVASGAVTVTVPLYVPAASWLGGVLSVYRNDTRLQR